MNYEFSYMNEITKIQEKAYETNKNLLHELAIKIADNMMNDHLIYVFGTGHSCLLGLELFSRAGGLANIVPMADPDTLTVHGSRRSGALEQINGLADIIFDQYNIKKGDMIIINSNSGRNPVPVQMALRAKKEGVYIVTFTSLEESKKVTSKDSSNKKLYEIADMVFDNCAPFNDSCVNVNNNLTGPTSSIITFFLMHSAITEAIEIMNEKGFKPYIFQSQNVDGGQEDTIRSYIKYHNRVKTL